MKTRMITSEKHATMIGIELSFILADEFVLYIKTKNAHLNFEGKNLCGSRDFFEAQYVVFDEVVDKAAERIIALGEKPPGSLKEYLELSCLSPCTINDQDSNSFLTMLCSDHETLINRLHTVLREYNDPDISEFIKDVIGHHKKMVALLQSRVGSH